MRQQEGSSSRYLKNILYKSSKGHRLGKMDLKSSNRPRRVSDGNRNENQKLNIQHALILIKIQLIPTNNI